MDIKTDVKNFLSDGFNRNLAIALLLLGLLLYAFPIDQSSTSTALLGLSATNQTSNISNSSQLDVHFFFLPTCPHCAEQKPINEKIMADLPQANFIYHDVTDAHESELLLKMAGDLGADTRRLGVPTTVVGKQIFVGFDSSTTESQIRAAITTCLDECVEGPAKIIETKDPLTTEIDAPIFGKLDIKSLSLPVLAATLGFIDGFNPCAMWVLVYLISLLANLKDKKRMWVIVGIFLLSSGILYFLFMTAWLNTFLLLGYVRIITLLIGLFALGSGILSIKEYLETKGFLTCEVEDETGQKKTMDKMQKLVESPLTIPTLIGIVFLAFAVNSIEFVCSSAIPAVFTQVLALSNLDWFGYYGYMVIYVIFFMLDDMIVFGMAVFALSTDFGQKYAKYCKFLGGAIMFILGLLLLFAPNMLH